MGNLINKLCDLNPYINSDDLYDVYHAYKNGHNELLKYTIRKALNKISYF